MAWGRSWMKSRSKRCLPGSAIGRQRNDRRPVWPRVLIRVSGVPSPTIPQKAVNLSERIRDQNERNVAKIPILS
jgi:hypothetical protein